MWIECEKLPVENEQLHYALHLCRDPPRPHAEKVGDQSGEYKSNVKFTTEFLGLLGPCVSTSHPGPLDTPLTITTESATAMHS